MSSQRSKPSKPQNQNQSQSQSTTTTNHLSSDTTKPPSTHLAMVELKQRILTALSKLSDRDTHQIAVEELEKMIQSLPGDPAISMFLNCLYDVSDPKAAVKRESLRLIAAVCASHSEASASHLPKILSHVVRRLKDSAADSVVRDACRDVIGALSGQYLGAEGNGSLAMAGVFLRPFLEAMGEQNKGLQVGAAMCVARAVECGAGPGPAFHKLCPRICKLLNSPNFLAKAALLPVVSSLAQVGAIAQQSLENLLQSIHDCIGSSDWATRKAAADALAALALHSRSLIADNTSPTLAVLEASRFDKIKPVRESMTEALQLWKNIAGKCDLPPKDQKSSTNENCQPNDSSEKDGLKNKKQGEKKDLSTKDLPNSPQSSGSENKTKGVTDSDKAVVILKKKTPALSDKDLNPEFFQKLETRVSGDVEVVVPRRHLNSLNPNNEEEPEKRDLDSKGRPNRVGQNTQLDDPQVVFGGRYRSLDRDKWPEDRTNGKDSRMRQSEGDHDRTGLTLNQRDFSGNRAGFSKNDAQSEGSFINNKGNWLVIQRQLLQLERQQAHLMNMLQDFMGGSHDSMITLENRVRGLERVVEDMARDLSISSGGRRGGSSSNFGMGFDGGPPNRPLLGKHNNGFADYYSSNSNIAKFGQGGCDGIASGIRGRGGGGGPHWRSEIPEPWDFPTYGNSRNGPNHPRRAPSSGGNASASDKGGGAGSTRPGEGPSARSVWQASKDEATLEAIRVAGDDNGAGGTGRSGAASRVLAAPELVPEAMGDENNDTNQNQNHHNGRDPAWAAWTNAMDALHAGDADTAYAEVLSTGDDLLLVKLMDRTGPSIDQLSNEVANETLNAVVQFFSDQNLFDICLSWLQQLAEVVIEHGPEILGIPMELKREILLSLNEASSAMDPPEDWEGAMPDQIVMQLASSWEIDIQHHDK